MIFHRVPVWVQRLFPARVWHVKTSHPEVFLSFDDGPVPGATDYVLGELAKRNQKAVFFMVGDNVRKHPQLAKEVLASGHQIGNHTYHHLNGFKTSHSSYLANTLRCQKQIEDSLGVSPRFFRPPYGLLRPSQARELWKQFDLIMWDTLSGDYNPNINAPTLLKQTKKYTQAGSIVLWHDQEKTRDILRQALPDYLDFLDLSGWRTALL
ncbi:polysaccharide deacetylase family protein [Algoriphagus namhaensis]